MRAAGTREVGERIEALLDELTGHPGVREGAEELVRLLAGMYAEGLAHAVDVLRDAGPAGEQLLSRLTDDSLVSGLLALHGLHPRSVEDRVNDALDKVRPFLGSHAGGIELLGVDDDGVARLRLEGNCDGCPSSLLTVQGAVEGAIVDAAPELAGVEVEGVVAPPALSRTDGLLQIQPFSPFRDVECPVPVGQP